MNPAKCQWTRLINYYFPSFPFFILFLPFYYLLYPSFLLIFTPIPFHPFFGVFIKKCVILFLKTFFPFLIIFFLSILPSFVHNCLSQHISCFFVAFLFVKFISLQLVLISVQSWLLSFLPLPSSLCGFTLLVSVCPSHCHLFTVLPPTGLFLIIFTRPQHVPHSPCEKWC